MFNLCGQCHTVVAKPVERRSRSHRLDQQQRNT
jgi:predicted PP-loop superfamily ATPase